jgi:hypothetical protein
MAGPAVNLETVKTLVALHGQRKAARIAGLNENTVRTWAKRYKWKCAFHVKLGRPKTHQQPDTIAKTLASARNHLATTSPANLLVNQVEDWKNTSRSNLARFVAEASGEAVEHKHKLAITRKAKDLADIHGSLFPAEDNRSTILNVAFLTRETSPNEKPVYDVSGSKSVIDNDTKV